MPYDGDTVAVAFQFPCNSQFSTNFWNRRLSAPWPDYQGWLPGIAATPKILTLGPLPGITPSPKPPVRIFLGSEPAQRRAERVFVWSVLKVRDPGRRYEIHVMKDLAGFDRR